MVKKKRNPTKADIAAEESFKRMMNKWDKVPKFGRGVAPKGTSSMSVARFHGPTYTPNLDARLKASEGSLVGSTAKKPSVKYTGTAMKGTATLHKSNEVPVFSNEEIIDISKMRRG